MALPVILKKIKPHHLPMVWQELHDRFGFEAAEWKRKFESELKRQPRGTEPVEFILVFGVKRINPILNEIMRRPEGYPSFMLMVEEVVGKC